MYFQVEVNKLDSHGFSLRIFCEKRPSVFVKLMHTLDVLGLDVVHANITTFRGLVLNVFNAEVRFYFLRSSCLNSMNCK